VEISCRGNFSQALLTYSRKTLFRGSRTTGQEGSRTVQDSAPEYSRISTWFLIAIITSLIPAPSIAILSNNKGHISHFKHLHYLPAPIVTAGRLHSKCLLSQPCISSTSTPNLFLRLFRILLALAHHACVGSKLCRTKREIGGGRNDKKK